MGLDRRNFIGLLASSAAGLSGMPAYSKAATQRTYKAIAFDAFPIFDPRPIFKLADTLFPGKGMELSNAWRIRQFEYQWLRALGGQYADFGVATSDALDFAAKSLKLDLNPSQREQLMQAYFQLNAWPDVKPALTRLKANGIRLVFLSNMTATMLNANLRNAGLEEFFEQVLSTDSVRSFKPAPAAYEIGVKYLGLPKQEIVFAAFAGWDVAGAKWYGYPTFWVNRLSNAAEELGVNADASGTSLNELVSFVLATG